MQFEYEEDPWGRRRGGMGRAGMQGLAPETGGPMPPVISQPAPTTTSTVGDSVADDIPAFDYQTPAYNGPSRPQFNFPDVPQFHGPQFVAPDFSQIANDPSYQFRLSQGLGALSNANSAKGISRTGGAYKGLIDYGQKAASTEADNIWNRAVQKYGLDYTLAKDRFAPNLLNYTNLFGAEQQAGLSAFDRAWQQYVFPVDDEFRREQLLMGSQLPT